MKTIKVDDEVYACIQAEATPFEDDPNSVLRRKYGLESSNGKGEPAAKRQRIAHGERTPQEEFREPLLRVLYEEEGYIKRTQAIDAVGESMKERFSEVDLQPTKSGRIRWQNYVEFARNALADEGLLKRDSPRGVWELTDRGFKEARRLFG